MSIGTSACDGRPDRTRERPPANAVDPAERAAEALRDRLTALDADGCARDGEASVRQHPESGRLRAWWIGCLAAAGRGAEAEALVAAMLAERPGDVWAELAQVLAWLGESPVHRAEVLTGSAAVLARAPARRDALLVRAWALEALRGRELREFAAAEPDAPASARVIGLLDAARSDPARLPEALAAAHAVPTDDPSFVAVAQAAASRLPRLGRPVEALAWAEAGLARAPQAAALLRLRWTLLPRQPGAAATVIEAVLEDIEAARARFADRPPVLLAAADSLRALGQAGRAAPIEAEILARHADVPEAETVVFQRLAPVADRPGDAPKSFDPEALAMRRTMLEAYLARPRHHDPLKREKVARWRFEAIAADPAASPEAIVDAVDVMLAHRRSQHDAIIEAVRALAQRTGQAERAEALAREGIAGFEAWLAAQREAGFTGTDLPRRDYLTLTNAVLAGLYLKTGRDDDAAAALQRAQLYALGPFLELQTGLAELARRRGDHEGADIHLALGSGLDGEDGERCRRALEDAYRARTGSMRGFAEYDRQLAESERKRRKAAVLAGYVEDGAAPLDAAFERLDGGGAVTLAALRGKIVVLHLWLNTCSGCLLELPDFSRFVAAHRGEGDVVPLAVHVGGDPGEVAAWVRAREIGFDVVMDDGFSQRVGVESFPTTWFLDQEGRLRFTASMGLIRHLREEFDWRVEALRERATARAHARAVAG